jgi:hypothetical protein
LRTRVEEYIMACTMSTMYSTTKDCSGSWTTPSLWNRLNSALPMIGACRTRHKHSSDHDAQMHYIYIHISTHRYISGAGYRIDDGL